MSELGISEVNEIKGKAPKPKVLDCLKNAVDSDELEVILMSQGGKSWLEQIEMLRLQKRLAEAEKNQKASLAKLEEAEKILDSSFKPLDSSFTPLDS